MVSKVFVTDTKAPRNNSYEDREIEARKEFESPAIKPSVQYKKEYRYGINIIYKHTTECKPTNECNSKIMKAI